MVTLYFVDYLQILCSTYSVTHRAVNDSTLVPAHEYDFGLFPHCDSGTDSMRKCADSATCTDTNAHAGTSVGADSNYVARKM